MAYIGSNTPVDQDEPATTSLSGKQAFGKPKVLGARRLFDKKQPGSPGKLGKTSTKAESLSKLRGKGALA